MIGFLLALQFLTVIPLKIRMIDDQRLGGALAWFPLAGLAIGLILAALNGLLSVVNFGGFAAAAILVTALAAISGGIHLDGLADTFDALFSGRNKDEMLRIMRDPHVGVMGVVGIVCVLLLKIALFSSLEPGSKTAALILMCVLSRWSLVAAMSFFPYAREEGKAKVFMESANLRIFALATIVTLACVLAVLRFPGVLIFLSAAVFAFIACRFISKKLEGITGDSLGAVNELTEIFVLFFMLVLKGGVGG